MVFPEDFQPLFYTSQLAELRRFCVERSALMIPHHVAYPSGRRGANWHEFHEECTPVVEVYSWHGNSEDDRGPYPFLSGSPGGRQTSNTVQAALNRGLRFGFVGSSDNHSGFPGGRWTWRTQSKGAMSWTAWKSSWTATSCTGSGPRPPGLGTQRMPFGRFGSNGGGDRGAPGSGYGCR